MKKLIIKLLGLNTLINEINALKEKNEKLAKDCADYSARIEELEENETLSERDVESAIEEYLNNYDYATQDWVSGEISDIDIEEKVNEAIEDYGIEEKVRDLFNDASPAPMSEDDIKKEVSEAVKITLEKMVKALADSQG